MISARLSALTGSVSNLHARRQGVCVNAQQSGGPRVFIFHMVTQNAVPSEKTRINPADWHVACDSLDSLPVLIVGHRKQAASHVPPTFDLSPKLLWRSGDERNNDQI